MVWMLAAIFGAVALMRARSWSWPPGSYLFLHGLPRGKMATQPSMMLVKPMSFPPICRVTTLVVERSAVSWAGLVPIVVLCGCVMSAVVAPEQLTSVSDSPSAEADRWA
jgi:hypothetical protein